MPDENTDNPYAPLILVEEDIASYDLLTIARLYNRLGVVLKWLILLLAIYMLSFTGINAMFGLAKSFGGSFSKVVGIIALISVYLAVIISLVLVFLWLYSIFVIVRSAFVMKLHVLALLLVIIGTIYFPFTILVVFLLRRKAAQILRDGGIEITGGKVDVAKIPLENDY